MEDLMKRGSLTFIGVSIAVILISLAMEANGSAFASNPAWRLAFFLRSIFVWSWVLLVSLAFIIFLIAHALSLYEEYELRKRRRIDEIRERSIQAASDRIYAAEALRENEKKQEAEAQAKIKEQQREERILRETERRKSRSAKAATDEAMDSFG